MSARRNALFDLELARLSAMVADMEAIRRGTPPEDLSQGKAPWLDRWTIAVRPVPCLAGLSSGHPKLPGDNRLIGTSDLWLMANDWTWARTLSRWYRLGRPAELSNLDA